MILEIPHGLSLKLKKYILLNFPSSVMFEYHYQKLCARSDTTTREWHITNGCIGATSSYWKLTVDVEQSVSAAGLGLDGPRRRPA